MKNRPADASDLSALSQLAPQLASTFVSIASDIFLSVGPEPPPPPPAVTDPFDPQSCTGVTFGNADATARFAPGAIRANVGRFALGQCAAIRTPL